MAFELHNSSVKAFLVPNHSWVNVKLRGEEQLLSGWRYRGFDDSQLFILLSKQDRSRWLPVTSISFIEHITEPTDTESNPSIAD
ncbi:hypothetical protein [Arenicella xantha]|uniref:Uncharacterized protein n=1 Tax=Arenicella xantha TaxID=644221 RepID=A0A395JKH7_9GAMM|nr:hypothetical protein [Arenicella xantha]RBP51296.1 hypothetical protein DFR28_102715 [Arenicella xantha]